MRFTAALISAFLYLTAKSTSAVAVEELHQAAVSALHSENHDQAIKFLAEAIQLKPSDPALLNTAGVVLNSIGEIDRAAEYFATSLKLDPAGFNANYNAANLMHYAVFDNNAEMMGALDSSIEYYQKALETMLSSNETNSTISKEETVSFLNDASLAMKKRSKNHDAIELLTKVIEIDANNVQALGNLAIAYLDVGDIELAERATLMALQRNPDNANLHKNYAFILQKMGSTELAQKHLDRVIELENPPMINDDEIVFGMSFEQRKKDTEEYYNINIELKRSDNPIVIANELQAELDLDLLTYRWLHCTFHHALARLNEEIVLQKAVNVDGKDLPPIIVRYGDDIFALVRSYAHQHGIFGEATDAIYENLVGQVPQHSELSWVNSRKRQLIKFDPENSRNDDYLSTSRRSHQASKQCQITLAITTSGKLELFYNLIRKFPVTDLICEVMVFDYLSSAEEKATMIKEFPQINFLFIAEQGKGHAQALNKMMRLAKTSYLLYLNDSWEPLEGSVEKIKRAYLLMEAAGTLGMPIAQVLMNEQSARSCALGLDIVECQNNEAYGKAGWSRTLTVGDSSFEFLEHEFGVQYADHHSSSSWPGFSSHHPALWNLNLLTSNANNVFREDHEEFDMLFALQLWESGMTTAHLPDIGFRFIGQ